LLRWTAEGGRLHVGDFGMGCWARVLLYLERQGDFIVVMEVEVYNVLPDRYFMKRVEELCGRHSVRAIDRDLTNAFVHYT
jgi:hypothetical protein